MKEIRKNISYCRQDGAAKRRGEKIKNKLLEMGIDVTSDDTKVVATGYGRIAVDFADHVITEITCHARGGRELAGGTVRSLMWEDRIRR